MVERVFDTDMMWEGVYLTQHRRGILLKPPRVLYHFSVIRQLEEEHVDNYNLRKAGCELLVGIAIYSIYKCLGVLVC